VPSVDWRDAGIRYILEVCRSLLAFGCQQRYFGPPTPRKPFSENCPGIDLKVEDQKQIFVFDRSNRGGILEGWRMPGHFRFTLCWAKTGLRIGELVHLLIEDLDLENWLAEL